MFNRHGRDVNVRAIARTDVTLAIPKCQHYLVDVKVFGESVSYHRHPEQTTNSWPDNHWEGNGKLPSVILAMRLHWLH